MNESNSQYIVLLQQDNYDALNQRLLSAVHCENFGFTEILVSLELRQRRQVLPQLAQILTESFIADRPIDDSWLTLDEPELNELLANLSLKLFFSNRRLAQDDFVTLEGCFVSATNHYKLLEFAFLVCILNRYHEQTFFHFTLSYITPIIESMKGELKDHNIDSTILDLVENLLRSIDKPVRHK